MKKRGAFFISQTVKNNVKRLVEMGKDNAIIAIRTGYKISMIIKVREELGI